MQEIGLPRELRALLLDRKELVAAQLIDTRMFSPMRTEFCLMKRGRAWLARMLFCAALLGGGAEVRSQSTAAGPPSAEVASAEQAVSPEEWLRRLNGNKLAPGEIASVAALALRAQADDASKWDPQRGDFVELARKKGAVTDDQWRDYLLGAVRFRIRVPTSAKRSAGLLIWVDQENARTGKQGVAARAVGTREDDLSGIAIKPNDNAGSDLMNLSSFSGSGRGVKVDLTQDEFSGLKPGPQIYHYRYVIQVMEGNPGKALGQRTVEGSFPWQLLAEDEEQPLPALAPDPALRAAVVKSLRISYISRDERDKTLVQIMIQADHPPAGMGFDMSLRVNGETWPLGPVAWAKGQTGWWAFDTDLPEGIGKVNVALVPSARAVARLAGNALHRLADVSAIWDGPEIVLPGVPAPVRRVTMATIQETTKEAAREYAWSQMDPSDPAAQRMKRERETSGARADLERRVKEHPEDAAGLYELGCVLTADGSLPGAMERFLAARQLEPALSLRRQIQRQVRRLCAIWAHLGESDAKAMAALGSAYEHGWGVTSDVQEAKRWYRNASNAGNAEAMCRLAAMYERKLGATVFTDKADEWYRTQAREWYRKAANLGNEEAQLWQLAHE